MKSKTEAKERAAKKPSLLAGKSRAAQRVRQALRLLKKAGVPVDTLTPRRKEKAALALFAIANMKPDTPWSDAAIHGDGKMWRLTSRQIIEFENEHWGQSISPGSYDDIRRKDLLLLILADIAIASVENPNASKNDPTRRYAVCPGAEFLLHSAGTDMEDAAAADFVLLNGSLEARIARRRPLSISAQLPDGKLLELADGEHNRLQKAILELFLPHFVKHFQVLYVADVSNKSLHVDTASLLALGLPEPSDDMLPDVVVHDRHNNWVLLIEAVHSSNPISAERHLSLENFTKACSLPKVYISVFANRAEFRNWVTQISWETEVWLADAPSHMIHFNGDKFLGPHVS